jgi:excisionase family DNA binding protein
MAKNPNPPFPEPGGKKPRISRSRLSEPSHSRSVSSIDVGPGGSAPTRRHRKPAGIYCYDEGHIPSVAPALAGLVTVAEAAKDLRVSQRSIRRWIATGGVQVVRFGRAVRIPRSEVRRLAETGIAGGPAPEEGPD